MLAHPDPAAPIALTTDASKLGIGGVLEQFSNGIWQPLGFWSRHLKPAQHKWSTFRRELYAVQQGLRHFITEVEGRHLVIFTDHKPLLGAFKSPELQPHDPIASNQLQEISMHTNDIRYLSGKANCVADFLSRPQDVPLGAAYQMPAPGDDVAAIEAENKVEAVQQIALEQASLPVVPKTTARYWETGDNICGGRVGPKAFCGWCKSSVRRGSGRR